MADAGRVAAALDEIRAEFEAFGASGADFAKLLAALTRVLERHSKITVYALSVLASDSQEPPRVWCGHTYLETENSRHRVADDESVVCLDKPEGDVCASCYEDDGCERMEWPCPTYRAISAELLGEEADHG